jgi:DNA-binding MarR family transcriptional regulator
MQVIGFRSHREYDCSAFLAKARRGRLRRELGFGAASSVNVSEDMMDLTGNGEAALRRTQAVLNQFQVFNPTMPIQMAASFLQVALNEGKSLRELCELSDTAQSTMSRHLLDLGERNRRLGPGLGLVIGKTDPVELRKKQFYLTPKGRVLLRSILALMEDGSYTKDDDRTDGVGERRDAA